MIETGASTRADEARPCYVCNALTRGRTPVAWVVRRDGAEDDGVVLPAGTPVCDDTVHRPHDGSADFGCLTALWFATLEIDAVARRCTARGETHG